MKDIAERIEYAASTVGGVAKLADLAGIPKKTIYNWTSRVSEPRVSDARLIAEVTGHSPAWLMGVDGGPGAPPVETHNDRLSIARYSVTASAGDGAALVVEEIAGVFTVPRNWLATIAPVGARLGIVEGRGDSMWPTIGDGDLLIVNFSIARADLAVGGIFVFTWDGDIYCKRLAIDLATGDLLVVSDNAALYPLQRIPANFAEEKLQLHCKVIRTIAPPRNR